MSCWKIKNQSAGFLVDEWFDSVEKTIQNTFFSGDISSQTAFVIGWGTGSARQNGKHSLEPADTVWIVDGLKATTSVRGSGAGNESKFSQLAFISAHFLICVVVSPGLMLAVSSLGSTNK